MAVELSYRCKLEVALQRLVAEVQWLLKLSVGLEGK